MPLPANSSISLQGHSRPGEGTTMPKIAMVVRMTEETLDALQGLSGADRMDFEFGDKPGIYVRDQFFSMHYDKEKSNQELFIRTTMPNRPNAPLRLNANVVGKFSVDQVYSDKLAQRVQTATAAAEKQKAGRKAILVESSPLVSAAPQKPAAKAKGPSKGTPKSTPTIVKSYATSTPNQTATTGTSTPVSLPKELATVYRQRLVHYLALGPASVQNIFKEFGGSETDHNTRAGIMDLLHEIGEREQVSRKVATSSQDNKWRLKPQTWLEIRPYVYQGYTDNVRTKVARTARTWLGSLKIPENDPAWDHVKFRDNGQGHLSTNANSAQRAMNGTSSAAAKAKKAKATKAKETETKVKSEAALPPRSTNAPTAAPLRSDAAPDRASASMRIPKGKEREAETEKEEGELSASQTPPRMPVVLSERRPPGSRSTAPATPTMPPPPVPVSSQQFPPTQSSSVPSKRTGPVDARGPRRPAPPEARERAKPAPPIPPPAPVDRKPVVLIKKETVQVKKERVSLPGGENGVSASGSSSQSAKERELDRRERERESDRESLRIPRRERDRESDRESVRGRDRDRALKERDREREQGRPKEKQKDQVPSRPVTKPSTKRKSPESDGESSDWGYEDRQSLRKSSGSTTKVKRERESTPLKTAASSLKAPKRESPPPRQKIKREPSPLPPAKTKMQIERKAVAGVSSSASKTTKKEVKHERPVTAKTHKKQRPSVDFTSSSEEEEAIPKPKGSKSTSKTLAKPALSATLAGRPLATKNRPIQSKHDQLRSRYSSTYSEYILTFQQLVAQKNKFAAVVRHGSESPGGDSDVDMGELMTLNDLAELKARHQRLHDELEEIKKSYMA